MSLKNPAILDGDYIEWAGYEKAEIDRLIAAGHDGMMNEALTEIVAFRPEQIKKMEGIAGPDQIGQNGAPPLFSRSPADLARGAGAAIKAMTVTDVKNKLVDYRGPALQSLRKAPDQGRRVLAPKTQRGKDMNWCRYVSQPPAR